VNALDIGVVAIIVLSGLFAFARGFVKEVLSIVSWFGATYAALYAYPYLRPYSREYLPAGPVADAVGGIAVFIVALIILTLITSQISRRVKRSGLSALDRTFGLIFGLLRGALIVCIAYIALAWVLPPGADRPRWIAEARTLPLVATAAEALQRLVPQTMRQRAAAMAPQKSIQSEVEDAIRAYAAPAAKTGAGGQPNYAPADQAGMNRLFEQLGSNPDMQREFNKILQDHGIDPATHPELQRMVQQQGMSPQVQQQLNRLLQQQGGQ
jgi:membrane protein required for colicin V production